MHPNFLPLGDSALMVHFGDQIDLPTNLRVHALDGCLQENRLEGVIETVPAYATLLVHYDPLMLTLEQVTEWLKGELERTATATSRPSRRIEVPVAYGGEAGPDLQFVAAYHHTTATEIVRRHTGGDYTVYMMGFTPGFAYMGKLDDELATPRLETPRTRVRAGTVGIAGAQTGIYPIESPGGWRLIGRTSMPLVDMASSEPFLFAPGDTVRFVMQQLDD